MENISARGYVDAFLVSKDGKEVPVASGRNTLSYLCADAVAQLFCGTLEARPQTIAFVYGGSSSLSANFGFTTGDRNKSQADILGTGLSVHDVSIDPNPKRTSSDSTKYSGNIATISAMTTDNTDSEWIYGFILKDGTGSDANVLAVRRLDSPVQRPANYAMRVAWSVTFS